MKDEKILEVVDEAVTKAVEDLDFEIEETEGGLGSKLVTGIKKYGKYAALVAGGLTVGIIGYKFGVKSGCSDLVKDVAEAVDEATIEEVVDDIIG